MFCIFAFEKKDGGDFKIVFKLLTLKKWRYKHYTALFLWTMGRLRRGGLTSKGRGRGIHAMCNYRFKDLVLNLYID